MNFCNGNEALLIAKKLYPSAKRLELIEHGYDNVVVLVDELYAIKFPRNENSALNNRFETAILPYFQNIHNVQIPKYIYFNEKPTYTVYQQVLGESLNKRDIANMAPDVAERLGEDIANFAYKLHSAVSVDQLLVIKQKLGHDPQCTDWANYFRESLYNCDWLSAKQNVYANEYYAKWLALDPSPKLAIHDDLHKNNLLMARGKLSGIIDFGDMTIGTVEQELRMINRFGDNVLVATVKTYEKLAKRSLNKDAIHTWSICQELAKYANYSKRKLTDNYSYKRAKKLLSQQLSDTNW